MAEQWEEAHCSGAGLRGWGSHEGGEEVDGATREGASLPRAGESPKAAVSLRCGQWSSALGSIQAAVEERGVGVVNVSVPQRGDGTVAVR